MELFQGDRYARQLLRQHRRLRRDFWGLVLLQLLFWLTEGTAAVLLLRLLERPAGALLTESVLVWRLVQGVWYAVSLPLSVWCRWTVRLRVTQCSGMGGNGLHVGGRAVFLSLLCTLLRTAALLPAALFLSGAYHLARMGTAHAESAPWLFGSMQCVVAALHGAPHHARQPKGTAGDGGVVRRSDAARGDHPPYAAPCRNGAGLLFQHPCPAVFSRNGGDFPCRSPLSSPWRGSTAA